MSFSNGVAEGPRSASALGPAAVGVALEMKPGPEPNGNAGLDRSNRVWLAVAGHFIAAGIAVLAVILAIAGLFAYDSCVPKPDNYGCGSTVHMLNVAIPVGGNVVGIIGAAVCTWASRARPRLRWLGIGLGIQVVSIVVGFELLPY